MPSAAPPARIGKTTGTRPRPANSEKLPRGAKFHQLSELRSGDVTRIPPPPPKKRGK